MSSFDRHRARREATRLEESVIEARNLAERLGLDPFPVNYWIVDYDEMNELIAYEGFQDRYPHWRWGMKYDRQRKQDQYLGGKAFEIVNNDNPAHAFLQESNELADQKAVITHVEAHSDFFANNEWFGMFPDGDDGAAAMLERHARRIREIMSDPDIDRSAVERWMDNVLSIADTINQHRPFDRSPTAAAEADTDDEEALRERLEELDVDATIREAVFDEADIDAEEGAGDGHPPREDVLAYLRDHGKQFDSDAERAVEYEEWQREILEILRTEAYYFAGQRMTKVMNEGWACVAPDTRVFTADGLRPMAEVVEQQTPVSDGTHQQSVYDSHVISDHDTITIETSRGFELTGSNNHRIRTPDGDWARLDALSAGDDIIIAGGDELWPTEYVSLTGCPTAGQSSSRAVGTGSGGAGTLSATAASGQVPSVVSEPLGRALGMLLGAGTQSHQSRSLTLLARTADTADTFADLIRTAFGVDPRIHTQDDAWQVTVTSSAVYTTLHDGCGLDLTPAAQRSVPESILQSPAPVVAAFLQGLFDTTGTVTETTAGFELPNAALGQTVQLLLTNFGILTRRQSALDHHQVAIAPAAVDRFIDRIGITDPEQVTALDQVATDTSVSAPWTDEVVAISHGTGDVYDISVTETHRYAAAGFINHNSKWESTMMADENFANDEEFLTYADHMSKVLGSGGLNPYKLGLELWEHIENRTNRREVIEHLLRVEGITWRNLTDAVDFDHVRDLLAPPDSLVNITLPDVADLPDRYLDQEALDRARDGDIDLDAYPWKVLSYEGLAHRHYSLVKPQNQRVLERINREELERIGRYLFDDDRYTSVEEAIDAVSYTAGWDRIREVRASHNDVTFLDAFLTQEFVDENSYFTYEYSRSGQDYRVASTDPEDVKRKLLLEFTNFGKPTIVVEDGNYENRNELLLAHRYNGIELDHQQAKRVLERVFELWGHPVNLKTIVKEVSERDLEVARRRDSEPEPEEQGLLLRYDGDSVSEQHLEWDAVEHLAADSVDYDTTPEEWL